MFRWFRSAGVRVAASVALAVSAGLLAGLVVNDGHARTTPGVSQMPADAHDVTVALSDLPAEARRTHRLILQGGPFPYTKDGTVFQNRERLLPRHPRGFYREYTVRTPGLSHRGARRIVCGGWEASRPENCYYTADHYSSFRRIAP